MIQINLNLPIKRRLVVQLTKRRGSSNEKPLLPNMDSILRAKSGNKFSRIFRYIFEHKNIKKAFGVNMAFVIFASALSPQKVSFANSQNQTVIHTENPMTTIQGVRYPVEGPTINQRYSFIHPGYDFEGITGDPVYPIMAGVVVHVDYAKYAYGNSIIVSHGNGITTLYAHLSKVNVEKDQPVDNQTVIGLVGETGRATGDHLHMEVRDHGYPINPSSVLPK